MVNMINKKTIYCIAIFMIAVVALVLLPSNVNAVTISENGTYNLIIQGEGAGAYINGNSMHQISFNLDEGEETVTIEELTKDLDIFGYGRKFLGWKEYFSSNPEYLTEVNVSKFGGETTIGGITVENAFTITPVYEDDIPTNSGTYYLVINSFWGNINGKDIEVVKNASSSFGTVDLTKYVPTYDNMKFMGWSIDGEKFVTSISAEDFKKAGKDVVEVIGIWKTKSFTEGLTQNFRLDANGGTIDGKSTNLYNWYAPSSMYPVYLLGYTPVKEDSKFLGWNTKADGTGDKVTTLWWEAIRDPKATKYELDEEGFIKLYAVWEKNGEGTNPPPTTPVGKPEVNTEKELSTVVEGTEVEVKVELEKALEEGSKLQIVKVAEEKVAEVKKIEKNLKAVFDINVVSNAGEIIKIEDNKMQIRILLEESLRGYDKYQVVYIKDGKIVEEMPTKIEGNYIVFETTHLSEYGIIANNNEKVEETQKPQTDNKETQGVANKIQNPQTGDNVLVFGIIFVVAVLGLTISTKYNSNKIK